MAIDYQHPEYQANIDRWRLVDNVCSSRNVEQYLITLNPTDTSAENNARNKQYKALAVLYGITGHTLQGLIGLMFSKPPETLLPSELEYMLSNIDGGGVSIYQQSQDTAKDVEKKGRAGLLVSFPPTPSGVLSKADMASQQYLATVTKIDAEQIINWRTVTVGAVTMLSLVVIAESAIEIKEDGYETESIDQIRELALVDGVYTVQLWRKNKNKEWERYEAATQPTDSTGNRWTRIPFQFVGSEANTQKVDDAPLYSMAKINLSHYQNSADYEDSVFYSGQAQPWMSGVTQDHVNLMKENKMYIGSRELMGTPSGEQFGFASADPNPMVRQAMLDKLDMMIGMGARHIQGTGPAKTAEEAAGNAKAQYSGLALVSSNVSEAYTQALKWAAQYMGANGDDILYQTTTDFITPTASAQDIQAMVAGFIQGAIPMSAYFAWLKKVELVGEDKTLDEFSEEIGRVEMPDMDGE